MPLLKIHTNAKAPSSREQILKDTSSFVSGMLGKPEKYVMVKLETESAMFFGGNATGALLAELRSINLPEDQTKEFSEELTDYLSKIFNISYERIFVIFDSVDPHMWGLNGKTFGR
ncbi:MAG: tautomerase family protein [Bacteroidales bacterium]|nr:tautomerase family protein [Bacteroidales bacterium]MCF8338582.1 tautomerase family protein [Bacteroidales bacterium]